MSKDKPVQVPEPLHRQAKSAAAAQGMSLKQWVINLIKAALGGNKPAGGKTA